MSFLKEIPGHAARKAASRPMWQQDDHGMQVPLVGINTRTGIELTSLLAQSVVMDKDTENNLNKTVNAITLLSSMTHMGDKTVAHFCFFLQLPYGSVELDSHGLQQTKTRLLITYRSYQYSMAPSRMGEPVMIPVLKQITALDVVKALLTRNRDHYSLDPTTGSGCRYWCQVVISDWIEDKLIDNKNANCVEELTTSLKAMDKYKHVDMPIPAPRGRFF